MIFRGFQGGFSIRKLNMWVKSMNRFRVQGVLLAILISYPSKEWVEDNVFYWIYDLYQRVIFWGRPIVYTPWNAPVRKVSPYSLISYLPPSENYFYQSYDREDKIQKEIEDEKHMKFNEMHKVDIYRTRGFIHHPSRETNGIVEGELYRNEQDKIVETMKVMMAEYCVKKGIWKNLTEAFRDGDEMKKKSFRQLHRS